MDSFHTIILISLMKILQWFWIFQVYAPHKEPFLRKHCLQALFMISRGFKYNIYDCFVQVHSAYAWYFNYALLVTCSFFLLIHLAGSCYCILVCYMSFPCPFSKPYHKRITLVNTLYYKGHNYYQIPGFNFEICTIKGILLALKLSKSAVIL